MSVIDPHDPNDPGDAADPALDRLLAQARWEEPAADEYRLREEWMHLRRRRRIMPMLYVAAAASVVVAVGMIALMRPAPVQLVERVEVSPVKWMMTEAPQVESRPANAMERFFILQIPVTTAPAESMAEAAPKSREAAPAPMNIAALLGRIADPSSRDQALEELRQMPDAPVDALLERLGSPSVEERFAAVRALGALKQPHIVESLTAMARRNEHRREALIALALHPSAGALVALTTLAPAEESQLVADKQRFQNGS